jgi:hypothetical protein
MVMDALMFTFHGLELSKKCKLVAFPHIQDHAPCFLLQPHFEASVRMRLTLPKVGTWSPPGLSQLQSSIAEVKNLFLRCSLYHWKGLEV